MRRLFTAICLTLLLPTPSLAHDAHGIKCFLSLESIETDGNIWTTWVRLRMKNTSPKDFKHPELAMSVRDKFGSTIDFFAWSPKNGLEAGRQKLTEFGLDTYAKPKTVKMTGCHRASD